MNDVLKYNKLHELKSIYRKNPVKDRKESTAEHTWSCLMLAEFLLPKVDKNLDKEKVFEILLYHDIVEIETGDAVLIPGNKEREGKEEREEQAINKLEKKFPNPLSSRLKERFKEFEERNTMEAKFAKAVDALDPMIEGLTYPDHPAWSEYSREFIIKEKEKYFKDFPELKNLFHKVLDYLEEKKAFE